MANEAGIVKRGNSYFLDPKSIVRKEGFNPRFDFGEIEELAKSIQSNGILTPLRVKRIEDGKFELIDGDRRLTAVEYLIKKGVEFAEGVPAILADRHISEAQALIQMFVANTGKPFLPLEEAEAYSRMRAAGMTLKQIGEEVGRGQTHIQATLALLSADESVKDAVRKGKINGVLGKHIAQKAAGNIELQKELVARASSGKAGRKAVAVEVEQMKKGNKKRVRLVEDAPSFSPISAQKLSELERDVISRLGPLVKSLGLQEDTFESFISEDDARAASFYFGALLATRAAMGLDVKVKVK